MPEKRPIKPSAFSCWYILWHDKVNRNGKMKIKQMSCHLGAFSSAPPSCQISSKPPFNTFSITYNNNSDDLHWEPGAGRPATGLCNSMQCAHTSLQTVYQSTSSITPPEKLIFTSVILQKQNRSFIWIPLVSIESEKKVRGNKDDVSWELILLLSLSVIQNYNYKFLEENGNKSK